MTKNRQIKLDAFGRFLVWLLFTISGIGLYTIGAEINRQSWWVCCTSCLPLHLRLYYGLGTFLPVLGLGMVGVGILVGLGINPFKETRSVEP